jgi:hypothetical protein
MTDQTIPHTTANVIEAADRPVLFKAIPGLKFDWSNDEWAAAHAPSCRIANLILRRNDRELERMLRAGGWPT